MSRAFVSASSQYLAAASAVITDYPFTVHIWFKPTSFSAFQALWCASKAAGSTDYFVLGLDTSGRPCMVARTSGSGTGNQNVAHSASATLNAWNCVTLVYASATDRRVYLNGDAGTQDTTSVTTPVGIDAVAIGRLHRGSPTWYANALVADVAVWNADVATSTVRANLAARWDPRKVAPTNLISFAEFRHNASPETDALWSGTFTLNGSPAYSSSNPLPATTKVEKSYSGRITVDDCSSLTFAALTDKWSDTGTVTKSIVSGKLKLAASDANAHHTKRATVDPTTKGDQVLGVTDAVISVDVSNIGANNGPAKIGLYKDASNYYDLSVAITSGGTSAIRRNGTNQQTVAKGVAASAEKRVKLSHIGAVLGGLVDGTAFSTYTDGSPHTGQLELRLGAPNNGSGTSDWRFDNLDVCEGNTVYVEGPTGGSAQLHDLAGNLIAQGTVSGGLVSLDCAAVTFPITGRLRVYTDSAYTTLASDGELYANDIRGGDRYVYNSANAIIGADFIAQYATTQADSHNGAIIVGTMAYGAAYGTGGSVLAWQRDLAVPGSTVITVIEPEGTIVDQHAAISIQRASDGYLHLCYGNSPKYRKSIAADDTQAWDTSSYPTGSGSSNVDAGMVIDQADNLYLVGVEYFLGVGKLVCYKKPAGSAWGSVQTLVTPDGSYDVYLSDVMVGKETGGAQKSIWVAFFMYDGSTYRDCGVMRTTDAAANWKGLAGGNFTLPLTTTAGVLSDSNAIAHSGTGSYVARLAIGGSGTYAYLSMWDLGSGYPKIKRGTVGTSWDSFTKNFTSVNTHGAMEEANGVVAYIWAGPSNNHVGEYVTQDFSTWLGPTDLVTNSRASSPPQDYWAKLTSTSDYSAVYALWQSRGTTYQAGTSNVTGEGCASLFMRSVPVLWQNISAGLATETDTGLAITVETAQSVGLASEVDTAFTITPSTGGAPQSAAVDQASETDTGLAATPVVSDPQSVSVGVGDETDSALAIAVPGTFTMNFAGVTPGTVVGAYLAHEWIGPAVPYRSTGSYPGPVVQEVSVGDHGEVTFLLPAGEYIAWMEDFPTRRRFFKVTEEDSA